MRLGINKQAIILAVFFLFTASSNGQEGRKIRYQLGNGNGIGIVHKQNNSFTINYSVEEVNLESITNENGSFYRVSIPYHTQTVITGKPELPVYSRLITIPDNSEYSIKISDVKSRRIKPSSDKISGLLYPAQEGETKSSQQKKRVFQIDKDVYSKRDYIQSDTVTINDLGIVGNTRLSNILVNPVRFNPRANTLEVIISMKIEVTFIPGKNLTSKSQLVTGSITNGMLENSVINYSSTDLIPGYQESPVQMIILSDTAFKKQLQPLIKWKNQKGFKLNVLYIGTGLAGNTYTQLRDTLTKIYNSATITEPAPQYLLIIGDTKRVPYYGAGNFTDMYYGEYTGNNDYIPELFIGRIPAADTTEVNAVVNKILQYEKFQFADTNKFYSRAIASTGVDGGYATYMNGQVKYAVTNYLTKGNKITESHFYYPHTPSVSATTDSIYKLINKGVSFINYTGHGSITNWLYMGFSMDTAKIKNKNMYPFFISNACETGKFYDPSSLGNRIVLTPNKGGVGFIGCSNDSYWDEDFYWSVGAGTPSSDPTYQNTGLGGYDRLFHSHGETASNWYYTMGQINYAGNLAVSSSTSGKKKYYWETYNLIGDPSIIPIIGTPDPFTATLPDTLPNGTKSFTFNVPPFTYAAISHFDNLWDASYASPSGSVTLHMPGLSNDSCLLVLTGQNKIPKIKTIKISNYSKEYLNLVSTSINDSQGNSNGQADFGETFNLNLKISNLGLADLTGLYAKISTSSGLIKINSDSVYVGLLPARSETNLSEGLSITVSGNVTDLQRITVYVTLKDDRSAKTIPVDIIMHAPVLQIINCVMDDATYGNGDNIADPGEKIRLIFKIQNQGSSTTSGQFTITNITPQGDATVLEPSVKSGDLKFGQITDIPIIIKLSETMLTGSAVSLTSVLDCTPFIQNRVFTFRIGRIRESFEAASFNVFPWINPSSSPWVTSNLASYDGNLSARSGAISDNGKTSLIIRTNYSTADSLKFYYKVSSENNWDFLTFKLNGKEVLKKSGETGWVKFTIAVPAGYNIMEWIYSKDPSDFAGSDCAWIDLVDFAESASVRYIQKDLQVARIVTPIEKDKYGQGTISLKLKNLGKDVLSKYNIAYQVNNLAPVKQIFDLPITPFSDSVSVSFKTKVDFLKYGLYKITVYGYDNNDEYLANDTLSFKYENLEIIDSLIIFPNPFTDKITLLVNSRASDVLRISISNNTGIRLFEIEKNVLKGKNSIEIIKAGLKPGIYYINVRGTLVNRTIPILKVPQ
jgi:hypothetical protein